MDYDPDVDYTDYLKYDYHTIQDNNNVKSITNKTDMFWKPDNVSGEWKDYSNNRNNRNNSNGVIGVVLSQIMDAISGLDLHIPTRY